jgi:CBS domain containing-hemolysin-like protein
MTTADSSVFDLLGILAIFILVAANGFFVAAEFSLVAIRRSRVAELAAAGRRNAKALQHAVNTLDANLAATQLGITISSLALGWIGEPALAHLIEPFLIILPESLAAVGSHAIAVTISFTIITALHIVLGELAPKSLALQRSENTALGVVNLLEIFLFLFRPAILALNGLGNLVLKIFGLQPGAGEGSVHSPDELKFLIQECQEAGVLHEAQQEVVVRVLNIGTRHIGDIMTPRHQVDWIDADDEREEMLRTIRDCQHEQLLVGRGSIDWPLGMVLKKDLLDQVLDGQPLDPIAIIREPLFVNESRPIFNVLEEFKQRPIRIALILNEYGNFEGIVTQTDLLEAIAGDLPDVEGEEPGIIERKDGSLLIDGMMPAYETLNRLGIKDQSIHADFHTIAGFALVQLGRVPKVGETFFYDGWCFKVVVMNRRRIDKLLVHKIPTSEPENARIY